MCCFRFKRSGHWVKVVTALPVLWLLAGAGQAGFAQGDAKRITDEVLSGTAGHKAALQAVRGQTHFVYERFAPTATLPPRSEKTLDWKVSGDRFSQTEQRYETVVNGKPVLVAPKQATMYSRYTTTWDGAKEYTNRFTKHKGATPSTLVIINDARLSDMEETRWGYKIMGEWLHDAIRAGRYTFAGTDTDPTYGLVYRFAGSDRGRTGFLSRAGTQTTFWIAPRAGYLAVKSDVTFLGSKTRDSYRIERLFQGGDKWFPAQASRAAYQAADKSGQERLDTRTQITVSNIRFGDVTDKDFTVALKPGYAVKQSETNVYWRIGPNGEKRYVDIGPGRVHPLLYGPAKWFIGALTGLLLMTGGLYLRRRQRAMPA